MYWSFVSYWTLTVDVASPDNENLTASPQSLILLVTVRQMTSPPVRTGLAAFPAVSRRRGCNGVFAISARLTWNAGVAPGAAYSTVPHTSRP